MTGLAEAPDGLRRRRHKRYGSNGEILLRSVVSGPTYAADLFDISYGGCLVWLSKAIPFSLDTVVEVRLSAGDLAFRVMGTVRHSSENGRVAGIEFLRLGLEPGDRTSPLHRGPAGNCLARPLLASLNWKAA